MLLDIRAALSSACPDIYIDVGPGIGPERLVFIYFLVKWEFIVCGWLELLVEVVYWGLAIMLVVTVLYGYFYSKRNGVNMNTFPGLFELFGHVFTFKNKVLSGLFIFSMYGGAIIGVGLIVLIFYAQSKGCNIHVKGSIG